MIRIEYNGGGGRMDEVCINKRLDEVYEVLS